MNSISLNANAKINLSLDVTGLREDGYHIVRMVMQAIDLHDEIFMEKIDSDMIKLTLENTDLPADESNLAYRAAALLKESFAIKEGVSIKLIKNIPVAAGLAGGSTDCAAVLKGMNLLFDLGLNEQQLCEYGVKLGADVPFCIMGKTALSEGIGEILTPLPPMPDCSILLVKPTVGVSTAQVYHDLDQIKDPQHPNIDGQLAALESGILSSICQDMENILESVTIPMHPVINDIKEGMLSCGAIHSLMSGSGPTVFGIYSDKEKAQKAQKELQKKYPDYRCILTQPV
jgi:4-diphosphocytidyl-2-C-methyl-D-erythritol kinase